MRLSDGGVHRRCLAQHAGLLLRVLADVFGCAGVYDVDVDLREFGCWLAGILNAPTGMSRTYVHQSRAALQSEMEACEFAAKAQSWIRG